MKRKDFGNVNARRQYNIKPEKTHSYLKSVKNEEIKRPTTFNGKRFDKIRLLEDMKSKSRKVPKGTFGMIDRVVPTGSTEPDCIHVIFYDNDQTSFIIKRESFRKIEVVK